MKKTLTVFLAFSVCAALIHSPSYADVHRESVTSMKFGGALGTMMKLMGANKPVNTADYYKGDLQRTDTMDKKGQVVESRIVDLDRELFITIDHDKKRYSQMTFAEWRDMVKSKLGDTKEAQSSSEETDEEHSADVNMKFEVDISRPGETEQIAGKTAEKVIFTIRMEPETTGDDQRQPTWEPRYT